MLSGAFENGQRGPAASSSIEVYMNQDQVKSKLEQLEPEIDAFTVIFSGKESKKANGVYHPEKREIIIHNKNFTNDNQLLYTAVHEFAHHVHFCRSPVPISSRAHTTAFRSILHHLLAKAEELTIYTNIFETEPEFTALTARIRKEFVSVNGQLMKELGALFIQAQQLCEKHGARFEDYIERIIRINKSTATSLMKIHSLDIDPSLGYENMRTIAGIGDVTERLQAQQALQSGQTPDMVKINLKQNKQSAPENDNQLEKLLTEKRKLERSINNLHEKLKEIEQRIEKLEEENEPA